MVHTTIPGTNHTRSRAPYHSLENLNRFKQQGRFHRRHQKVSGAPVDEVLKKQEDLDHPMGTSLADDRSGHHSIANTPNCGIENTYGLIRHLSRRKIMSASSKKETKTAIDDGGSTEIKKKIVDTYKKVSPFAETPYHEKSWDELQAKEKRRRGILTQTEEPFWKILAHWDGTCLQILLKDSLLWIVLGIYAGIRVQSRLSVPTFVSEIASGDVAVIGGFLSFFLVFFVNQNHKRFFNLYGNAMTCKGRIFDCATLASSYLPKEAALRLVRYMNAAHAAAYVGLSKTYPSSTFFAEINKELRLLTDEEHERMKRCNLDQGGACNRELIAWCIRDIHSYHKQGLLDNETAQQFREQILQLRAAVGQMFNAADLPIPFFYVHFICLLTALYLPLFAVTVAFNAGTGDDVFWAADVVGGLVVLTQTIFVQGLRILGQKMNDPFGDDMIDLSVIHFVVFNWRMSNRVLRAEYPKFAASLQEEEELSEDWIGLGEAWDKNEEEKVEDGNNAEGSVSDDPTNLLIRGESDVWRDTE